MFTLDETTITHSLLCGPLHFSAMVTILFHDDKKRFVDDHIMTILAKIDCKWLIGFRKEDLTKKMITIVYYVKVCPLMKTNSESICNLIIFPYYTKL